MSTSPKLFSSALIIAASFCSCTPKPPKEASEISNLRASKQHPREENNQTYPVEAALELALPLAGHGDGRGPLLELAGAGLPMRGALAVLLPLALVLLHHVELGHGVAADGFGFAGAAAGEEGRDRERERGSQANPWDAAKPFTLCCLKISATVQGNAADSLTASRFVRTGATGTCSRVSERGARYALNKKGFNCLTPYKNSNYLNFL